MNPEKGKRQLWLLALLSTIGTIGVSLPGPIFAPMLLNSQNSLQHSLMIPDGWPVGSRSIILGLLLAMYPFGMFLGSPILGSLSDQFGRRKLIIGSLLCATLGYGLTVLALFKNSLTLLLLSRLFTGFAEGNVAIFRSAVADIPGVDRHYGFGIISTGCTLGYVIGPPLGALLSDSHVVIWFNSLTPFTFSALTTLVAALLARATLYEHPRTGTVKGENSKTLAERFNIAGQLRELFENKQLKTIFVSSFYFFAALDIFYEFFPAFLVKKWDSNSFEIALFTVVLSSGIALGSSHLSQFWAKRVATLSVIFWHIVLFMCALLAALLITQKPVLYFAFFMIGIFVAVSSNHFYVQISERAGVHQQGEALGMATGLRMLADAAIALLGGILINISTSFPFLSALVIALGSVWLVHRKIDFPSGSLVSENGDATLLKG